MPKLPVLARGPRKYQKRLHPLAISAQTIVAVLALALGSLRMVQAEANDTDTTPHYSPPNLKLGSTLAGVMVLLATCVLAIYWIWHNLKHGTPDAYAVGGRWRRPTALGMGQLNPLDKEPPSSDAQSPTAWETDPPGSATSRLETGGLGSSTRVLGGNPMLQRGRIGCPLRTPSCRRFHSFRPMHSVCAGAHHAWPGRATGAPIWLASAGASLRRYTYRKPRPKGVAWDSVTDRSLQKTQRPSRLTWAT